MTLPSIRFQDSIAAQLLKVIFGLYLIVAILVTAIQLSAEYYHVKETITQELRTLPTTFGPGITNSLWTFNRPLLQSILTGMHEMPIVAGVQIEDKQGRVSLSIGNILDHEGKILSIGQNGKQPSLEQTNQFFSNLFGYAFPVIYTEEDGNQFEIGNVTIYSSTSVVVERVQYGFFLIVINSVIKTLALWGIFLFFLRKILGRPLEELTTTVEKVKLDNLEHSKIKITTSGKSELKVLEEAFNKMIENLSLAVKEREQAEAEVQESESRLRQVIDLVPHYIHAKDKTGKFLLVNRAQAELYSTTVDQLVGTNLVDVHSHKEEVPRFLKEDMDVIETRQSKMIPEIPFHDNQGRVHFFQVHKIPLNISGTETSLTVTVDITELKQAQSELQRLNEELEQRVKERTQELQQSLETLKKTQHQMIQSEKLAALGKLVASVAHEINSPLGAIKSSIGMSTEFLGQTLEQLPSLCRKLSLEEQNDFLMLLNRSIRQTDIVSAYEKRQYRQQLSQQLAKDFPTDIAEEIAHVLTGMRIYNQVEPFYRLLKHPEREFILEIAQKLSSLHHQAQSIKLAVERAGKVTFALKSYSRLDHSEKMVLSSIHEGIETVLTLYHGQMKHGVEVIRQYEKLPPFLCHPDELNQVWINLIHNALQAMEYQGTLTIQISQENDHVQVAITDNGKGIPKDIQDKIFEPFFTTKPIGEGSGLGLDIVKKIIEKHRGRIDMESALGQTCFTVTLPLYS